MNTDEHNPEMEDQAPTALFWFAVLASVTGTVLVFHWIGVLKLATP